MKLILSLLGVTVLSLFFISCQKEIDWGAPQSGLPTNDGNVLSKYIELDTTLPAGQDTVAVYTFSYDNLKRIKRIYQVKNFSASTTYVTTDFFYNGTDALPYKTVEVDQEAATYIDTSFFSYSSGFVSLDSSVNYRADNNQLLFTNVISFSPTGTDVFVRFKQSTPVSSFVDTSRITINRQNGNIVVQRDPTNAITDNLELKYDNKVNPFYNVDIHYPIFYEHLFNSFNAQRNNRTDALAFSKLVNPKRHVKYNYTYRSDGYPVMVYKIDLLYPDESRTGVFLYTK